MKTVTDVRKAKREKLRTLLRETGAGETICLNSYQVATILCWISELEMKVSSKKGDKKHENT